jgi:hypothetical protein
MVDAKATVDEVTHKIAALGVAGVLDLQVMAQACHALTEASAHIAQGACSLNSSAWAERALAGWVRGDYKPAN